MCCKVIRGAVLRREVIEESDEFCRKVRRLAVWARLCLDRHSERMKIDPDYREAVDRLTTLLSARPGRLGEMLRVVVAGHALLVMVL